MSTQDAVARIGALAASGVGPSASHRALHPADVPGLVADLLSDRMGADVSIWIEHPDPDDLEIEVGHGHEPELVVRVEGADVWRATVSRPEGSVVGTVEGRPADVLQRLADLLP